MKFIKNQFNEFKSVFVTEDLLKENEVHANIVTSSTMLNLFWLSLIVWVLDFFKIFRVELKIMNMVLLCSTVFLFIPAIICFINKGKSKWMKHYLFISFTILLAIADMLLKYNVTLVMVIPAILAARYYNEKFTLSIAIFTTLLFIGSAYYSVRIGQQDLNTYNLIIPSGTNIKVDTTLRDAISKLDINEAERLKNIFIHFVFPKILVYNMVAFACVQISRSGKNMLKKQVEITQNGQRIETELALANSIQKSMLPNIFPPFPEHKEIDLYASMIPAKEVGGDFYDMFLIDDDHLAICVADVSGKGVPASLVMMITKILIKNVTKIEEEVNNAFNRVNNMMCDGNTTGIFVTCWFGVLDLRTGEINFVNAGHNPPLVYSKKNREFTYLETKANLVLAGMEDTNYTKQSITIEPGDRIFLYTDGVVEATNNEDKLYGEDRLKDYLNNNIELDSNKTILGVKEDIDKFVEGAEQFDDITMLELIYKNKKIEYKSVKRGFKANKKELSNVQSFVEKELSKYECDKKLINNINLAIEEVFINIANYAYKDKEGKCTIEIIPNNSNITIIFADSGIKFNPLEKEDPDTTLSVKDREVGGLGIYLTKKIMDKVDYKYQNNKNILTMTKKI